MLAIITAVLVLLGLPLATGRTMATPAADGRTMATPAADIAALDAFIAQALVDYRVPGAAVAVVQHGQIVLLKGYGVRDATNPDTVDEHTIFQLASVTKALTAAAAASVVDQGTLAWDTPITTYLPEFVGYDPYMTRWLTLRDLLAHRTGWPEFTGDRLGAFGYSRAEIVHRLRDLAPAHSLREVAQYSNPGFFLAGEVAARAARLSWNELVEQRLYAPLDMPRSGTSEQDLQDPNAAAAHALVDEKIVLVERTSLDIMGAAGSASSTAADMAHWMQMLLNEGRYGETQVLTPESVQELFKRSMVAEPSFSEVPPISDRTGLSYGLGVGSFDYAGYQIIEKGGATSGVRTVMNLIPELDAGIVVLANLNLTTFPEAVRAYWINQQLGIDPTTDQQQIRELNEQLQLLVAPPPPPANPGPFLYPLSALVGTYENQLYGPCTISLSGDTLSVRCGPADFPATLRHWDNGQFMLQFPGATEGLNAVTFTIGADGSADSFLLEVLGTFTRVRPATAHE
jgi:CubicO group peptidase (beta-lactamase class C family)